MSDPLRKPIYIFKTMRKLVFTVLVALSSLGLYNCQNDAPAIDPVDTATSIFSAARIGATPTDSASCRMPLTKIETSALPAAVTSYISANFAGATIREAGKDSKGTIIVRLTVNDAPRILAFNADGTFRKELPFRNGKHLASLTRIEPSALPKAITNYLSATFPGAEVKMAAQDVAQNFLVMITVNGQPKALQFNADGSFKQELTRPGGGPGRGKGGRGGNWQEVAATELPAPIKEYVTKNHAGLAIQKAGKDANDGRILVWLKGSDNQHTVLLFAADGTFVQEIKRR